MTNPHSEAFAGTVRVGPIPGVTVDLPDGRFRVEKESIAGVPVKVMLRDYGACELGLAVEIEQDGGTFRTKPHTIPLLAPASGRPTGHIGEQEVVMQNDEIRVNIHLKGGSIEVDSVVREGCNVWIGPDLLGPPYSEPYLDRRMRTARFEEMDDGLTCVLTSTDERFPGVVVHRRIVLGGGPYIRVSESVGNASGIRRELKLRTGFWPGGPGRTERIFPLEGGPYRTMSPLENFPADGDINPEGDRWAETWIARSGEGTASGILWTEAENIGAWSFDRPLPPLEPGATVESPAIYAVVAGGDWKTIRDWWQRLIGGGCPVDEEEPEALPHLRVETSLSPLLAHGRVLKGDLQLISACDVAHKNTLKLTLPDGWSANADFWTADEATAQKPFSASLELAPPDDVEPGAYAFDVVRSSETTDVPAKVYGLILGDGAKVSVDEREDGTFEVSNGLFSAKIAPGFRGSVFSLVKDGIEHLRSPYPEPDNFSWMRPWFGGISPFINYPDDRLHKETFAAGPVERRGARGFEWKGVKLACAPDHKDFRGRGLEVEYLTTGGSNLLAVVVRLINLTTARLVSNPGISVFAMPGGDPKTMQAFADVEGEFSARKRCSWWGNVMGASWAGIHAPETDRAVIVVPAGPKAKGEAEDAGVEGPFISARARFALPSEETVEAVYYVALLDDATTAPAYSCLKKLRELP